MTIFLSQCLGYSVILYFGLLISAKKLTDNLFFRFPCTWWVCFLWLLFSLTCSSMIISAFVYIFLALYYSEFTEFLHLYTMSLFKYGEILAAIDLNKLSTPFSLPWDSCEVYTGLIDDISKSFTHRSLFFMFLSPKTWLVFKFTDYFFCLSSLHLNPSSEYLNSVFVYFIYRISVLFLFYKIYFSWYVLHVLYMFICHFFSFP